MTKAKQVYVVPKSSGLVSQMQTLDPPGDKFFPVWVGGLLKLLLLAPPAVTRHGAHVQNPNEPTQSGGMCALGLSLTPIKSIDWTSLRNPLKHMTS